MKLKRQYDEAGACTHVLVIETGFTPEQNFSHRLVEEGVSARWIELDAEGRTLTMRAKPEDLVYQVLREPGYYCKSTGEAIPITRIAWDRMRATGVGDLTRREALTWLQRNGKQPHDYEVTNAYECVLSAEQHAKYCAVRTPSGDRAAACRVETATEVL